MDHKRSVFFEAYAFVNERYAYGSRPDRNMLCKIDVQTGMCEYIGMFPDEGANVERLHLKAVTVEGKIIFSPSAANNVAIYDPDSNEFTMLPIYDSYKRDRKANKKQKYGDIVICEHYAYVIPAMYSAILKIDMCNKKVISSIEISGTDKYVFRKGGLLKGDLYYISSANSNIVLILDTSNDSVKLAKVGENNNGSWSIVDDGKAFWILPYIGGKVIKWDISTGKIDEFAGYPHGFKYRDKMFIKGVFCHGKIIAVPTQANMVLSIDVTDGSMSCVQQEDAWLDGTISYLGEYGEEIYLLRCMSEKTWLRAKDNRMYGWNKFNDQINTYEILMNNDLCGYVKDVIEREDDRIMEDEIKLQHILKYMTNVSDQNRVVNGNNYGEIIHNMMRG